MRRARCSRGARGSRVSGPPSGSNTLLVRVSDLDDDDLHARARRRGPRRPWPGRTRRSRRRSARSRAASRADGAKKFCVPSAPSAPSDVAVTGSARRRRLVDLDRARDRLLEHVPDPGSAAGSGRSWSVSVATPGGHVGEASSRSAIASCSRGRSASPRRPTSGRRASSARRRGRRRPRRRCAPCALFVERSAGCIAARPSSSGTATSPRPRARRWPPVAAPAGRARPARPAPRRAGERERRERDAQARIAEAPRAE